MSKRTDDERVAADVMAQYPTTLAQDAGIALRDTPAPLFRLLVLSLLCSAPISTAVATRTARELFDAGWTTPDRLRASTWQQRVDALGRGGYRRYDESTARYLDQLGARVNEAYRGDLRRLRDASEDPRGVRDALTGFERIGPTGAGIFCREVQGVWPALRPWFDATALAGAKALGLPDDPEELAGLVEPASLPHLAAALAKRSRAKRD